MRLTVLAALACTLAVIAAGCGTSGKAKGGSTTTNTNPTGLAPALAQFTATHCRQLVDLPLFFTNAVSGLATNPDRTAAMLKQFAQRSPIDIAPDFRVLATAASRIATTLKGVGPNTPLTASVIAKLKKIPTEINTTKVTESAASVASWARTNGCAGIK